MKVVEGVKIVMQEVPQNTQVFVKIKGEPMDLAAQAIVWWPIDIHIDEKSAVATLRIRIVELEMNGVAIIEKPDEEQ